MITAARNSKITELMEEMKTKISNGSDTIDVLNDYAEYMLTETQEYMENVVLAAYFLGRCDANDCGW